MLTLEEIQSREFLVALRGYDRDEVHAFLDRVADHIRELESRLQAVDAGAAGVGERPAADDPREMFAQIGQETHRILEAAHEAGSAIKRTARQEADRALQDARAESARTIAEGERRREAIEEVVAGLEAAKAQLAEQLRGVGRTIEGSLRDLIGEEAGATSVREALAAEALPDDAEPPAAAADVQPPAQEAEPVPPAAEVTDELPLDDAAAGDGQGPAAFRQAALSPLQMQLVRQIKRGLHDVQNVVLDRLRRADGRGELESFLPTDDELLDFTMGVAELLDQAYSAGRAGAVELAGRDLPEGGESRDLVDAFITDAAERMRGGLAASLRMGLEVDEELASLSGRVSAVFGEIKQSTADEWADAHLIRAYELGQLDAWAAGGITRREWVLGPEPRCPEGRCRHNGQSAVLEVSQPYPSGHLTPPVHPGCTCTTAPVLDAPGPQFD